MAKFYLVNNVRVGSRQLYAGDLVNDALDDVRKIREVGGVLVPDSNGQVASAAVVAQSFRRRGSSLNELSEIMQGALAGSSMVLPRGADIAATATVQWSDGLRRVIAGLGANATITLGVAAGADGRLPSKGDRWFFTRTDIGAFTVAFVNGGGGGGTLATLVASKVGFLEAEFDGVDWGLVACSAT